jgi:hypothetical protein
MSKDWRIIFRIAVLGLTIASVFFGVSEMDPAPGSFVAIVLGGATLLFCPGSLLFVLASNIEPQTTGFAMMWLIIGLINCALYAAIGALCVGLRKKPEHSGTS